MGNVLISTTIPEEIYREIKEKCLKYNQLMFEGLNSRKGMPAFVERINQLESDNKELELRNKRLFEIIRKLEGDVNVLVEKC